MPGDALGCDLIAAAELVQDVEDVALDQARLRTLLEQSRLRLEDEARNTK